MLLCEGSKAFQLALVHAGLRHTVQLDRYAAGKGRPDAVLHGGKLVFAALFAQCGIDTVRITGGEPLVRRGVEQLTAGLKAIPGIRRVALTTNGVLLAQKRRLHRSVTERRR